MLRFASSLVLLLFGTSLASAFAPGEKVVVVQPVEMKTTIGTAVPLTPGTPLNVKAVEAERLQVEGGRIGWIAPSTVIAADKADAYFSDLLKKSPQDATTLEARGTARFWRGDHARAIVDLEEAVKLSPTSTALTIRGFAWKRSGDKEKAMADFNRAIELDPKNALAWRVRGATYAGKAEYAETLKNYSESIRLDPDNPDSLHHRAVLLSGCMDDEIRNGKQALADAMRACEVSGWNNPLYLSGLGMAYSELGDFENAVKWQTKLVELTKGSGKDRLAEYQKQKPFRTTWR